MQTKSKTHFNKKYMETGDVTLVFKKVHDLDLNHGLVMEAENQSIAIIKRMDKRGIYYSINDTIDKIPQKPYHDESAMLLILLNAERFKYPMYTSRIALFK